MYWFLKRWKSHHVLIFQRCVSDDSQVNSGKLQKSKWHKQKSESLQKEYFLYYSASIYFRKGKPEEKKKGNFYVNEEKEKKKKRNKKETRAVYIMLTIILWSCKSCWCLRWNSCPHRCCWSSRFSYSDRRRNVWQQGIHYLENQKLKKTSDFWRVIHKINGHMISFKLWHSPQNLLNSSQLGLGKFCVFFIANRTYSWSLVRKFFAIWRLSLTDSVS